WVGNLVQFTLFAHVFIVLYSTRTLRALLALAKHVVQDDCRIAVRSNTNGGDSGSA
ncbi:MAG: hypothetical protein RLZZ579_198, partial [Actinomycetota bacterium]